MLVGRKIYLIQRGLEDRKKSGKNALEIERDRECIIITISTIIIVCAMLHPWTGLLSQIQVIHENIHVLYNY